MVKTTITLSDEMAKELESLKASYGLTKSEIVSWALQCAVMPNTPEY